MDQIDKTGLAGTECEIDRQAYASEAAAGPMTQEVPEQQHKSVSRFLWMAEADLEKEEVLELIQTVKAHCAHALIERQESNTPDLDNGPA